MSAFKQGSFTFRGSISGFVPSIAGGDPDHDITVSPGAARSDDGAATLEAAAAITKKIDVNWAEGDNQGGFPSGLTLTADTWYKYFAIRRSSDGNVDYGFDASLSATNLLADATDYANPRYIGSVLTDVSANIIAFTPIEITGGGIMVLWDAPPLDVDVADVGTAEVLRTVSTPLDKRTLGKFVLFNHGSLDNDVHLLSSLDIPDSAPSITTAIGSTSGNVSSSPDQTSLMSVIEVLTNLSSQIRSRDTNATADLRITTIGYTDFRTV
jgi:hypothetical protein